jgi:hypothetical protein
LIRRGAKEFIAERDGFFSKENSGIGIGRVKSEGEFVEGIYSVGIVYTTPSPFWHSPFARGRVKAGAEGVYFALLGIAGKNKK